MLSGPRAPLLGSPVIPCCLATTTRLGAASLIGRGRPAGKWPETGVAISRYFKVFTEAGVLNHRRGVAAHQHRFAGFKEMVIIPCKLVRTLGKRFHRNVATLARTSQMLPKSRNGQHFYAHAFTDHHGQAHGWVEVGAGKMPGGVDG